MAVEQRVPPTGPARERLRQRRQFWTPDWMAEAMAEYALGAGSDHIFDPAVGAGAFLRAAKAVVREMQAGVRLLGTELDPSTLEEARASGLGDADLAGVEIRDFVLDPPAVQFKAIVANPPYMRHHRLPAATKKRLRAFSDALVGRRLDGRAGLHVYFLLRALQKLDTGGRLAFILPADTFEGVFAQTLWSWIAARFRLQGVVTFAPEASPFPAVDTNAVIVLIANADPSPEFAWAHCKEAATPELKTWMMQGCGEVESDSLVAAPRQLSEALKTGFSRPPVEAELAGPTLGDFARVMRGVVTGANEFFFLTPRQAQEFRIPGEFLRVAVGRTRDIPGDEVDAASVKRLEEAGRPTLLFCPDGRPLDSFPSGVAEYLRQGELQGIHRRTLIATRRPWYKMERRAVPPILFAYLGRRNARFLQNRAGVIPLTCFLCVYPRRSDPVFVNNLWAILSDARTAANLRSVGKSYGGGAIKVEPRALEKLALPAELLRQYPLERVSPDGLPF
jgi:hypothetical protein